MMEILNSSASALAYVVPLNSMCCSNTARCTSVERPLATVSHESHEIWYQQKEMIGNKINKQDFMIKANCTIFLIICRRSWSRAIHAADGVPKAFKIELWGFGDSRGNVLGDIARVALLTIVSVSGNNDRQKKGLSMYSQPHHIFSESHYMKSLISNLHICPDDKRWSHCGRQIFGIRACQGCRSLSGHPPIFNTLNADLAPSTAEHPVSFDPRSPTRC